MLETWSACEDHPVVLPVYVVGLQVTDNIRGERVLVQDIKMVIFAECINGEFPINVGAQRV